MEVVLSPLVVLKSVNDEFYVGKCRLESGKKKVWLAHEQHSELFNSMSEALTALHEGTLLNKPIVNDMSEYVSLTVMQYK